MEVALARLLRANHSAVSTGELREIGFSKSAISRLVDREVLLPHRRGAYRSGLAAPSDATFLRCFLLSAGDRAALTRRSAAHVAGHIQFSPHRAEIVVPRRPRTTRRLGFDVFGAPDLAEEDVTIVDGLRTTTPFRTTLDLAASTHSSSDLRLLRRALRQATTADPALPSRLHTEIEIARPFAGCRILSMVLGEHLPQTLLLRSNLEAAFLELCIEHGIPLPETNAMLLGNEMDMLWRKEKVYVELDTYDFHGGVRSFESDRARDGDLAAAGFRGIRVTDRRLEQERLKIVRQTKMLLALGSRER